MFFTLKGTFVTAYFWSKFTHTSAMASHFNTFPPKSRKSFLSSHTFGQREKRFWQNSGDFSPYSTQNCVKCYVDLTQNDSFPCCLAKSCTLSHAVKGKRERGKSFLTYSLKYNFVVVTGCQRRRHDPPPTGCNKLNSTSRFCQSSCGAVFFLPFQ